MEIQFFICSFEQENLALDKYANQSSTYGGYSAQRANDGDPTTCAIASVSPDDNDTQAYWQVDLGNIYPVARIDLTNIVYDQESKYLSYFVILVDNDANTNTSSNNVCVTYASNVSLPMGGTITFTCDQGQKDGRYVTVKRIGGFRPDIISLCEVAVYPYIDPTDLPNLALKMPAKQSITYSNYYASRANDGDPSTCSFAWAGDRSNVFAYWQVDLGDNYMISNVILLNAPTSYESSFLTNFTVLVGYSSAVQYDGSNVVCFSYTLPIPVNAGRYYWLNCTAYGRYLTVRRNGGYRPDAMSICEVYVPAKPLIKTSPSTTTLRTTISPMARECFSYEYICYGGRCIHTDWLCDGIKDCPYGDDESDSNCGYCQVNEVRCKNGNQCIHQNLLCDQVTDCGDGSDEENCIYFDQNSRSGTRIVLAKYKGNDGYQFCSINWDYYENDHLCKKLGFGSSQQVSFEKATSGKYLSSYYLPSNQCGNGYVIALKCLPYNCGSRSENIQGVGQYIVNGDVAMLGAWPWQIYSTLDGNYWCGGTIIGANWILTAAHCVYFGSTAIDPKRLIVYAGSVKYDSTDESNKQRLYVDQIIIHPRNDIFYLRYDFALLHLTNSIYWTDTARPICLPSANPPLEEYKLCVTTGFGRLSFDEGQSNVLKQGRMNLMLSKEKCVDNLLAMTASISKSMFNFLIDYSNMICAGEIPTTNGINICHGDSGGPLSCQDKSGKWTLIGVTSHFYTSYIVPYGCLNSIFAYVPSAIPWIQQYVH